MDIVRRTRSASMSRPRLTSQVSIVSSLGSRLSPSRQLRRAAIRESCTPKTALLDNRRAWELGALIEPKRHFKAKESQRRRSATDDSGATPRQCSGSVVSGLTADSAAASAATAAASAAAVGPAGPAAGGGGDGGGGGSGEDADADYVRAVFSFGSKGSKVLRNIRFPELQEFESTRARPAIRCCAPTANQKRLFPLPLARLAIRCCAPTAV